MATGPLSIKLRCASWQQLATIYKRDLSRGTMFLKAPTPPPIGTSVRIDLTLPSASVIVLTGVVQQHVNDPQRGTGVELKLAPIPTGSVWLIESALASETKRRATPAGGVPVVGPYATGPIATITEGEDVAAAEQDLIKALVSEAESLKRLNPFLVLGVGYESSDGDVRAAFGELTKRYHPDRFARYESIELRQVAAEIFILIRDAYRKLGDETARAQALAALGRQAAPPRPVPLRAGTPLPVPPPPRSTQKISTIGLPKAPEAKLPTGQLPRISTESAMKAPGAIPTLPQGVPRLDAPKTPPLGIPRISGDGAPRPVTDRRSGPIPTVPMPASGAPRPVVDHRSGPIKRPGTEPAALPPPPIQTDRKPITSSPPPVLTEVSDGSPLEALLDEGRLDEAVAAYKVMAKKHPQDRSFRAGIELCEGLRAMTHRDRLEAAQRFEAALEIDPSNERAARELADMRRQATNERKGLLSRLMGKKES
jgi:hypothetical protein